MHWPTAQPQPVYSARDAIARYACFANADHRCGGNCPIDWEEPVEAGSSRHLQRTSVQQQLLNSPVGRFSRVDFVLRRARESMRTGKLA